MAYPMYEAMAEAKMPVIFHSGHSGMGSGLRGGGGLRLKYSNPMHLDDVAADFPDMTIIIAHPSWPWQDEALSVCLHKPNVYIDLSGWSPKYFPPQLIHYANTQLKHKMLFGTDYPLITPERWMKDYDAAGFRPEVRGTHPQGQRDQGTGVRSMRRRRRMLLPWQSRLRAVAFAMGRLVAQTKAAKPLNIVVYGGSGNVGSRIVTEAAARGHTVTVVDRARSPTSRPRRVKLVTGDAFDKKDIAKNIAGAGRRDFVRRRAAGADCPISR